MSDQPQYRSSDQPTQQTTPYSDWRPSESVQVVRLDRPVYTGVMVGFGLLISSVLFFVIVSLVMGVLGLLFSGVLTSLTAGG